MKKYSFIVTLLFISTILVFKPFIVMAEEDMEKTLEMKEEMVEESESLDVDPDEPASESKDIDEVEEMEEGPEQSDADPDESISVPEDIDEEEEDLNEAEEPPATDSEDTDELEEKEQEEIDKPESEQDKEVSTDESQTEEAVDEKESTEQKEEELEGSNRISMSAISSELKLGIRDERVKDLKVKLNRIGFGGISVTDYFGDFTDRRLREFQQYYKLEVNGIAGTQTLAKLDEIYNSPLQLGKSHNDMIQIKQKLNHLGYGNISVTTLFGSFTEKRVTKFQKDYNLPSSGIIDTETLNKINSVFNSAFQKNGRHSGVIDLKNKLNKIGFGGITVTDLYGSFTERRVREFQQYYGLTATGKADLHTLNMLRDISSSSLQAGKRHEDVITLKNNLNRLGFGNITVTSLYGSFTVKKVKDFQRYYGLKVSGIADGPTLSKVNELISSPLQVGKRDNALIELKQKLNNLGYGNITVTTLYGSFTEKKVKDFQKDAGIPVSGIIDTITRNKINETFSTVFQQGGRHASVIDLKRGLNKLGFGKITITELYGSFTKNQVTKFQETYGLQVTGKADIQTFEKLNSILSSPYQKGKRHNDMIKLKTRLNGLGYGNISLTTLFGSFTEQQVKKFQRENKLPVSGIIDDLTYNKIFERLSITYTNYEVSLEQALETQMKQLQQTDKYRNASAFVSAGFIEITEQAVINGNGVRLRTAPNFDNNPLETVNSGTKITILEDVTGALHAGSTKWYKITYNNKTLYVHSSLANPNGMIAKTTANLNVRASENSNGHIYGVLPKGAQVNIIKKGNTWHEISYETWRNPTQADVEAYIDPNKNDEYQHLVLSASADVSANQLNNVLIEKGILVGLGQAFIDGGKAHSVNEIYLISHALLETGHGTSRLAQGIEVGKNKSGDLVLVTSSNRSSLTAIKTTYNMFGIGAADADPNRLGAIRAYNEGWFTPKEAIIGGAKFIGDRYIHNDYSQNTLYKMRWNPANPGYPQYATDIAWAVKQVTQIKNMYNKLSNPFLQFDIAQYK